MKILFKDKIYYLSRKVYDRFVKNCKENNKGKKNDANYRLFECAECGNDYLRFYANKTTLCCKCRLINREIRYGAAAEQMPGYPKKTAVTLKELDKYYSGDEIECLICGNHYSGLVQHITRTHEMSTDDYKLKFGLPFSSGLTGTVTRAKQAENGEEIFREHGASMVKKLREFRDNGGSNKIRRGSAHSPALQEKQISIIEKAVSSKNHISNRTNKVEAYCSDCGNKIERKVTEMAVITQGCYLLCKKCKYNHWHESKERWFKKNGIDKVQYMKESSERSYQKRKNANV